MLIERKIRTRIFPLLLLLTMSVYGYSQKINEDGQTENKPMSKYEKALKKSEEDTRKKDKLAEQDKKSTEKYEDALKKPLEEYAKQDKKAKKIESKADKKFVRQEFNKAMEIYEEATKKPVVNEYSATLHLKVARLYINLLEYPASIPHYNAVMAINESLFTPVDVCNYLDALRFSGEKMKAIIVAHKFAYHDAYRKDQRYLNIIHALNYEDGFLPVGAPEYTLTRLDNISTPYSEFWIGKIKDEYFYATSNSQFQDPSKKFFHRTKYYSLNQDSEFSFKSISASKKSGGGVLEMIPVHLQNGPLAFSDNMTKMVVTNIDYDKGENIKMKSDGPETFKTKLYFSEYDSKRKGWASFKPAFSQREDASYAHPFLYKESIIFSSDMTGGFGGYDLYIAHWDEKLRRWGDPINLGAKVNTEGDEISPSVDGDLLIFASNGHVGFGGYDLYSILYEDNELVAGSLSHFDYPINTAYNDFGMLNVNRGKGYIISDRNPKTKDDVYYFEKNNQASSDNLVYGMSESKAISNGFIALAEDKGDYNSPRHEPLPAFDNPYENMLNIYFDFDKANINSKATQSLEEWLANTDFTQIQSLIIDGYADELGLPDHNYRLSQHRAQVIADWLAEQGIDLPIQVQGKGQISLSKDELDDQKPSQSPSYLIKEVQNNYTYTPLASKIWMNRKARRVEIKARMK